MLDLDKGKRLYFALNVIIKRVTYNIKLHKNAQNFVFLFCRLCWSHFCECFGYIGS